jgi:histone-binding protein RBBP4
VLQWSIEDHITGIQEPYPSRAGTPTAGGGRGSWTTGAGGSDLSDASSIAPRGVFKGHSDTVEDVQFRPSSMQEFCSVGDDSCLVFWDARSGHEPTLKVEKAHDADLHCVDWNAHDENLLLTGYHFSLLRTCFCGSHNCQPIGIVTSQSKSLNFC